MNKNTITGIVLIAAILFGFSWYTSKQAKEQMALQAKQDSCSMLITKHIRRSPQAIPSKRILR